jgi:hypothetical protein
MVTWNKSIKLYHINRLPDDVGGSISIKLGIFCAIWLNGIT